MYKIGVIAKYEKILDRLACKFYTIIVACRGAFEEFQPLLLNAFGKVRRSPATAFGKMMGDSEKRVTYLKRFF